MTYVRIVLSGLAAIFVALFGPWLVVALKGMGQQRATGLAAIAGGPLFFSPLVWILAFSFFALFFTASGLHSKVLRVILFWIPTIAVDQFAATLATWFGADPTALAAVLPNLSAFSPSTLGFV